MTPEGFMVQALTTRIWVGQKTAASRPESIPHDKCQFLNLRHSEQSCKRIPNLLR